MLQIQYLGNWLSGYGEEIFQAFNIYGNCGNPCHVTWTKKHAQQQQKLDG